VEIRLQFSEPLRQVDSIVVPQVHVQQSQVRVIGAKVQLGLRSAQERITVVSLGSKYRLKEPTRIQVVVDNEYFERTHACCLP
jgi:hypothetical protein